MRIFDNSTPRKPKSKGSFISRNLDALGKHRANINKKRSDLRKKIGSKLLGSKTYQSIEDYRKRKKSY